MIICAPVGPKIPNAGSQDFHIQTSGMKQGDEHSTGRFSPARNVLTIPGNYKTGCHVYFAPRPSVSRPAATVSEMRRRYTSMTRSQLNSAETYFRPLLPSCC